MASINCRKLSSGATRHRVQWRHEGKEYARPFHSHEQAERWRQRLEILGHDEALALLAGPPPKMDMPTVHDVVAAHVEQLTGVTDGTRRRYRSILRNHIAPTLGALPLDLLTYQRAAQWVNELERAGKSGKTIRNVHSLLSSAMASAVRAGHVPENVVKGLRLPRTVAEEMVFLTPEEMGRFVGLTPERWRPLVALLFTSGLRFGEATALQVQDLDLQNKTIRVRQAWKATSGDGHRLGPPKSRRARRTVPIPQAIAAELADLVRDRGPSDFVFTNSQGGPVRHASFHSHVWTAVVHDFAGDTRYDTGIGGRRRFRWDNDGTGKRPRIHDCRHSFASAAIAKGYSLTSLQRHLGHETITTTSDTYGHIMPADRDAYASLVALDVPRSLSA